MLKEAEIKRLIEEDHASEKKRRARKGQAYYEANHDIESYKVYFVDADGKLKEDKTRSNIKIAHPFFTELVDQEVQYMLSGKDGFIYSDDETLQKFIEQYFDDDFRAELSECLTGVVSKGFEHMYAYMGADERTHFMTADSLGVVEVRQKDTDDDTEYVIYWYVDRVNKEKKKIKRIQVWNDKETYYFVQVDDGEVLPDKDAAINPRPHIVYKKSYDDTLYSDGNGGYGFIPFFRLDNNRKQISGLKPVKDLIDDYDLMACGLSNNLQDISEGIYVVRGFQGHDLEELINNLKVKKHIGVDADGGVDIKTIDIPYDARKTKLELDEKNIYRFGMGFNSTMVGDGNITNIVIKSRYALLDLKCNKLEIRLKQFLRKMIKIVLDEINRANGTDYQQSDVVISFEREVMTNANDNAQKELTEAQTRQTEVNTLLSLANVLDDETLIKAICDLLDIDFEDVKQRIAEQPENDLDRAQDALNEIANGVTDESETERSTTGTT